MVVDANVRRVGDDFTAGFEDVGDRAGVFAGISSHKIHFDVASTNAGTFLVIVAPRVLKHAARFLNKKTHLFIILFCYCQTIF